MEHDYLKSVNGTKAIQITTDTWIVIALAWKTRINTLGSCPIHKTMKNPLSHWLSGKHLDCTCIWRWGLKAGFENAAEEQLREAWLTKRVTEGSLTKMCMAVRFGVRRLQRFRCRIYWTGHLASWVLDSDRTFSLTAEVQLLKQLTTGKPLEDRLPGSGTRYNIFQMEDATKSVSKKFQHMIPKSDLLVW